MLNIIARKPRDNISEYIVVERKDELHHPFVSAVADSHSLKHNQWYWGHYFKDQEQAIEHFNRRFHGG